MDDVYVQDLVEMLTQAQREAVLHVDGPMLVLAGPGSGKTRVVTHRIAHLLRRGVPARQILALTFTNKAAEEMKNRLGTLAPGQKVWVSTFHRFCARMLREHASLVGLQENFTIYDTSDSGQTLKRVLQEMNFDSQHFTPGQIAAAISWAKNNLITAEQYTPKPGHAVGSIVARVYPKYQQALFTSNAVDFDDLLMHLANLLRENPLVRGELDARFRYILVDEYQDTNLAQYAIVRALSLDFPNLSVTGDPDQSIYGWRGANLSNIMDFEKDYPQVRVVRLEQNYRSTGRILRAADALIQHNTRRKAKDLFTENDEGVPVRMMFYSTQQNEAASIALRIATEVGAGRRRFRDHAIFYRTNALSRALEVALHDQGVPFQMIHGVEFYQRKEIKDLLAYLMLLNNPRDGVALLRTINTPARGIGKTSLDRLSAHAVSKGIPLLQAARESGMIAAIPKRTAVAIAKFVAMHDRLSLLVSRPVEELLGQVLSETDYLAAWSHSESEEDQDRVANVQELLTAARQFDERNPGTDHLEEFLENVCLVNDTDDWEAETDRVTLMTLHASKGLEFPVVFIIALEQGLIPHERSVESAEQLEEERRLLFVGLTRAEEELQLSLARYREFRGTRRMSVPSTFLLELPFDELDSQSDAIPGVSDASLFSDPDADQRVADEMLAEERPLDDDLEEGDISWNTDEFETAAVGDDGDFSMDQSPAELAVPAERMQPLITAAEMAGQMPAQPRVPPEVFQHGMVVRHPEYGVGKITSLSGNGPRRMATVRFPGIGGDKKFVLAQSPLRPAKT